MALHIVSSFDRDLKEVLKATDDMGRLVRSQLSDVAAALQSVDCREAERIMARDAEVNGLEVSIDARIEAIFACRQPAAGDLRFLIGLSRISVDLERMGDEIRNMARSVSELRGLDASVLANRSTLSMGLAAVGLMIEDVLDAIGRLDTQEARAVIERDGMIDDVYRTTLRSLVTHMMEDPSSVSSALGLMWIARSLERVGDHVKNVAEAVIYIAEGADVRHEFYTEAGSSASAGA